MFENVINFFKKIGKKDQIEAKSKDTAKERLHLVLMQDRANVSADFLDMMRQEIIEVIKKYIDVDEKDIDVRLTNKTNEDGTTGAPALYANIPIAGIREEMKKEKNIEKETVEKKQKENAKKEDKTEEDKNSKKAVEEKASDENNEKVVKDDSKDEELDESAVDTSDDDESVDDESEKSDVENEDNKSENDDSEDDNEEVDETDDSKDSEEVKEKVEAGNPYVIRLKSKGSFDNKIVVNDCIKGRIEFPENDMDIVLLKSDGIPTYHFAHAVDDTLMGTTHVTRGDEWVSSLPVHVDLFNTLGFPLPHYAHLATIQKEEDGKRRKISKRKYSLRRNYGKFIL